MSIKPGSLNLSHLPKQGRRATFSFTQPIQARGFTLIEVLLAFVVFTLSFTVVLEILSGAMRNTVRAKEYTEVALIAQSLMDQVGLDIRLEPGVSDSGEFGDYKWDLNITLFDDASENSRTFELRELTGIELLEVECVISWGSKSREHSMEFSTVKAVLANQLDANP